MEKKFKISFHAVWKNVQKFINVQGQIRSFRVEVGPKLNKVCSTFIRHTRVSTYSFHCRQNKECNNRYHYCLRVAGYKVNFSSNMSYFNFSKLKNVSQITSYFLVIISVQCRLKIRNSKSMTKVSKRMED